MEIKLNLHIKASSKASSKALGAHKHRETKMDIDQMEINFATYTAIYVSSFCYICVSSYCYICVFMLLYMCPHTAMYVSSYCYICVVEVEVKLNQKEESRVRTKPLCCY